MGLEFPEVDLCYCKDILIHVPNRCQPRVLLRMRVGDGESDCASAEVDIGS